MGLTTTQVLGLIDALVGVAGVADRAALRYWEPGDPAATPLLDNAPAPAGARHRGRRWQRPLTMAVATVALALAGSALLMRLPGAGEPSQRATTQPAATPTRPVLSRLAIDGRLIREGTITSAAPGTTPRGVEFAGIASAEGSGEMLIRARAGEGAAGAFEVLFQAPAGARILDALVSEGGARMSVAVCSGPRCTVPPPEAGAGTSTEILWSRDGGASFEPIAMVPGQAFVDVHVDDGVVVRMFSRGNPDWLRFPGGSRIPKPGFGSTPGVPLAFGTLPGRAVSWRGEVAWAFFSGRFVLDIDGRQLFSTGVPDEAIVMEVRHFAGDRLTTVTWVDHARGAFQVAAYRDGEPIPTAAWSFGEPLRVVGVSGAETLLLELPDLDTDGFDVRLGVLSLGSGELELLPLSLPPGVRLRSVARACVSPGPCAE
jgi:hypothetical protein